MKIVLRVLERGLTNGSYNLRTKIVPFSDNLNHHITNSNLTMIVAYKLFTNREKTEEYKTSHLVLVVSVNFEESILNVYVVSHQKKLLPQDCNKLFI
ncbi:hypothetical protein BpHYR1_020029 [Brachionus plicatilis]|uniref:Uncharacterized protein n=1 Tax=Brachionus plicatilis TaxID=10195 RepID=A0A3M7PHY4_BRAPC|nr:hypothetical protein BpHYR1_020029 [Brachionus plicatilis]